MLKKLLCLIPVVILTACGILSPVEQRPVVNYEINDATVAGGKVCTESASTNVIFVSPMQADLPYNSNKMYYTQKANELDAFGYSQWISAPNLMLTQVMTKKIFKSCVFKGVVTSDALADANYRLVTKLISLRQVVAQDGNSAEVSLVIYAELIDLDRNQVVNSNIFIEKQTGKPGPQVFADSANQLMIKFDDSLVAWLKQNSR